MNTTDKILVVSITPYFLDKEIFWFQENLYEILKSAKTQSFFQDNIIFLEKNPPLPVRQRTNGVGASKNYNVSELIRKLDEMGYEKVFKVADPGEFSQQGGIIDVFPINITNAVRLDFLGNKIENIQLLEVKVENEEKVYPPKFYEEKFRRAREILKKKLKSQKLFSDLKNLKAGDFLVHLDHGVAKFSEMKKINGQDYYALEYASNDKLYIPIGLERKLSKYVGFADPFVSRLGSSIWQKTKRKIKENVEKLAKELLALYAKKEHTIRAPYATDKELESQLKAGFLYEETPDQLQAIEDIKKDLKQEKPMDRIICGDIGFGKTEVAIRTAFLAGINGRQTAIICPTTILANQHFNNFKERFKSLPFKVSLLSRLQTKKEQQKIIKELKEGKIDIVIGTHRILSNDIEFKNLQLLIIDDEQRFGVKQKEKLRQKNPALDILSLSATPIPRTIYLALSSFKNISLMQTPPQGRQAIETKISHYNPKTIREAIHFELAREGQVYFLHNKVATIEKTKEKLEKLLYASPGAKALRATPSPSKVFSKKLLNRAKFSYIHGRMPEKKLIKIMDDFQKNKTNVLVATTIIENGIDLPNVNTIIVEDASRLGLSQAYQIKGRVGRSHIKSFAYLFYPIRNSPPHRPFGRAGAGGVSNGVYPKKLTVIANERLKALSEANELGSGYKIALKDMELRGAGNILGKEQSGSINKIGLNLYCQILAESVEKFK